MTYDIQKRQNMERRIIQCLVTDALLQGYTVDVNDGEEVTVRNATSIKAVMDAVMTTDEDYLVLRRPGNRGWVRLVYGNSGYDVVCDYSINVEGVLAGAEALAERMEDE